MPTLTIDRNPVALNRALKAGDLRSLADDVPECHRPRGYRGPLFRDVVVAYAIACGWTCWFTQDSRKSPSDEPDLRMLRERFVVAELKTARGTVRTGQRLALERLRVANVETYLWRPADVEEILAVLK